MKQLLSEAEREQVSQAIAAAEKCCGAEIVPVVVADSDPYPAAVWKAGMVFLMLALILLVAIDATTELLLWYPFSIWVGMAVITSFAGMLLTMRFSKLKRLFAGATTMEIEVDQRAHEAFVDLDISATEGRTGILIFVSLFEHRLEVIGDIGWDDYFEAEHWEDIVQRCAPTFKSGTITGALLNTISAVADMVEQSEFEPKAGRTNELDDNLQPHDD